MIVKNTYATPAVWEPDREGNTEKKLADSCEVASMKLIASGGAAIVKLYDADTLADATPTALKWILDASTTSVDSQDFNFPLSFRKGIYAVLEQGSGFNPFLCISKVGR